MLTINLEPCPFCGSAELFVNGLSKTAIACNNCGTEGPESTTGAYGHRALQEAIVGWNEHAKVERKKALAALDDDGRARTTVTWPGSVVGD